MKRLMDDSYPNAVCFASSWVNQEMSGSRTSSWSIRTAVENTDLLPCFFPYARICRKESVGPEFPFGFGTFATGRIRKDDLFLSKR